MNQDNHFNHFNHFMTDRFEMLERGKVWVNNVMKEYLLGNIPGREEFDRRYDYICRNRYIKINTSTIKVEYGGFFIIDGIYTKDVVGTHRQIAESSQHIYTLSSLCDFSLCDNLAVQLPCALCPQNSFYNRLRIPDTILEKYQNDEIYLRVITVSYVNYTSNMSNVRTNFGNKHQNITITNKIIRAFRTLACRWKYKHLKKIKDATDVMNILGL